MINFIFELTKLEKKSAFKETYWEYLLQMPDFNKVQYINWTTV